MDDFRVVDTNGNHLNWYTKLNYAVQNYQTGRYWNFDGQHIEMVESYDKDNSRSWYSFDKYRSRSCVHNIDTCVHGTYNGLMTMDCDDPHNDINWPCSDSVGTNHRFYLMDCHGCQHSENICLWKLIEYPYELFAEIEDFKFETLANETLKQHGKASLISQQIIDNSKSSATISREIKYKYKRSSELEVSHSTTTTKSWKGFLKVGINVKFSVGVNFLFVKGQTEVQTNVEGGFERTDETSTTKGDSTKNTEETEVEEDLTVNVGANKAVKVTAYQFRLDDVQWKYKAKLRVYGKGPSWQNDGKISPNIIRVLLQKQYADFDLKELEVNDDSIVFEENGSMQASLGLKSYTFVTDLNTGKLLATY